jgi:UDP-N-acetylglucosamine 2-epimerase (non-hydrolysing)
MKAFPICVLDNNIKIIHSGQHYDENMNKLFFEQLNCRKPDIQFILKNKSQIEQLTEIMNNLTKEFEKNKPKCLLVFGDVTTTLAGALVANKMNIPLCHIESGLRSFDRNMPEEINRILVDQLSDIRFITEESGIVNLENEGLKKNNYLVGNTMIDTLVSFREKFKNIKPNIDNYIIITLHRPSNVDSNENLTNIINKLNDIANKYNIVFPIHPRTRSVLNFCKVKLHKNINVIDPLLYLDFMGFVANSKLVITDSGGIQEETSYLGIPCITLRDNTERPVTLVNNGGSNILSNLTDLNLDVEKMFGRTFECKIKNWDGISAQRILSIVYENYYFD